MASTIALADYIFQRVKQLGVESIHGVPGDYNLALLDYVAPQGLHWVGNCNELNAGYATDAYARIKGLGMLITTFGVGELSAINAIAGAYAELAPVVHLVGTPARKSQAERAKVHHTFNDGDYTRFAQMYTHVTVAQTSLFDPRTCPEQVDATIQQCLIHSRPVYIQLPADMVSVPVSAERLQHKIELPKPMRSNDEAAALAAVTSRIASAQKPVILIDGESRAYGILSELQELVTATNWATWITVFAKSCISEDLPNFRGIWKGSMATKEDKAYMQQSDLILCFGGHFSNTNSYMYTSVPDASKTIMFDQFTVTSDGITFRDLPAKHFLTTLMAQLNLASIPAAAITNGSKREKRPLLPPEEPLNQEHFYKHFSQWLRPGDVVLAETGTAGHGSRDFKLPANTFLFKPITWLSIGYMLPAAQGAGLAQRELYASGQWNSANPRSILLIGDGSFQMTAQELSTIIREKLNMLIILINNDGYTIERCLHGYKQHYNDIATWDYLKAPALCGGTDDYVRTYRARSWGEIDAVMAEDWQGLKMVEIFMDKEDAPEQLAVLMAKQKEAAAVK